MKHPADFLTVARILLSLSLLFLTPLSAPFFVVYLLCGLSDMIDGPIARKTGTAYRFGAQLDSAADLLFLLICLICLLPVIHLPTFLWLWSALIALIRLANVMLAYQTRQQAVFLHTGANRLTGLLLFLLPLSLHILPIHVAAVPACIAATWAALQETISLTHKKNACA